MNQQVLKNSFISNSSIIVRKERVISEGYCYTYFMIKHSLPVTGAITAPTYSLRVEMTDNLGNTTFAELPNVFSGREKADLFFDKLLRNLATPLNLPYAFEDEMN